LRVAVVLAAGNSRRMGRAKLMLELGGVSLIERSVRTLLEAGIELVRLVIPPELDTRFAASEIESGRVELVVNTDRDGGLSSSLRTGVRALPDDTESILVALADKPFVKVSTVRQLLGVFTEVHEARVVFPSFRGEQGHPVVFDVSLADELLAVLEDRGAKDLIHRDPARVVSVDVDDRGVCFDIDTPEDYAEAQEIFRLGSGATKL
jgi:molybdenum cofactor cytidylyltransferase